MSFQSPLALLALLTIPVAVAAYVFSERRRGRAAERFASANLLPNLIDRAPGRRRHVPAVVLLLALVAMLIGLARPRAAISVKQENATVVLAVDTSRSMAAKDVRPTRLGAAKRAVTAFLAELPGKYRVGVVSFASDARVVAPATHDRAFVRRAIGALRPGEGTALGDAIARSLAVAHVAGPSRKRVPASILVLSDGTDMGSRIAPARAAQRARSLGVPVHTIAFGTENGIVEVPRTGGFVERIRVPPSPETLRRIAAATGGRFFTAATADALRSVYRELGSRLGHTTKQREITVAFAAGAAVLLVTGGALSALWFRRLP